MARIDLPDGRSLELRPQWLSEKMALLALGERTTEDSPIIDYIVELATIIRPAVTSTSWGGDVLDMDVPTFMATMRQWAVITDEAVLPEANGTASGTSSPAGTSPGRARRRSR